VVFSFQVSPPKLFIHFSFHPYVPHDPYISFFFIWLYDYYLVRSADHEAPNYESSCSPLVLLRPRYLPQHPILEDPQPTLRSYISVTIYRYKKHKAFTTKNNKISSDLSRRFGTGVKRFTQCPTLLSVNHVTHKHKLNTHYYDWDVMWFFLVCPVESRYTPLK
jgi:hypothetical protein